MKHGSSQYQWELSNPESGSLSPFVPFLDSPSARRDGDWNRSSLCSGLPGTDAAWTEETELRRETRLLEWEGRGAPRAAPEQNENKDSPET